MNARCLCIREISRGIERRTAAPSSREPARKLINEGVQLARKQGIERAPTQHYVITMINNPPDGFIDSITPDRATVNTLLQSFQTHRDEPRFRPHRP